MAFDPAPHLQKLRGGLLYLPVKNRLMWLREEHPDAIIETEMVHLDLDLQLAVFRARVTLPDGASATGYGSETERDFPAGWIEKSETKALGRALAALGFGTQFALDLDEGERVVDTPVQPQARQPRAGLKVVAERPAEQAAAGDDRVAALRGEVTAGLATDRDAASKLPKGADDMTVDELEKTLAWLRNRAKRQA
jgi:hypothetical protein